MVVVYAAGYGGTPSVSHVPGSKNVGTVQILSNIHSLHLFSLKSCTDLFQRPVAFPHCDSNEILYAEMSVIKNRRAV